MGAAAIDEAKLEAFMGQAVTDMGAVISAPLFVIGEKLGLYKAMRGSGEVVIADGEERLTLDAEHLVCVEPGTERTLEAGPEGIRVLCVGGVPGEPYREPEWTEADSGAE